MPQEFGEGFPLVGSQLAVLVLHTEQPTSPYVLGQLVAVRLLTREDTSSQ